jgi:prepilin-type N-terminal cleavage/methylation domain-containing protein
MCSTHTLAKRQRGFTVMELVITVVIMGILAVVGTSMISDTFTTARVVNAGQSSANDARYAVERLAREIREVSFTSDAAGYAITSTLSPSATSMTFNRSINGTTVTVTISSSGTNLTLGYAPSGSSAVVSTLATQVNNFSLDFLKLDETSGTAATSATTSPVDVRFVVVSLTLRDATSGQTVTERTRVALRNME